MRDFGLTGSYFRAVSITLTDFDTNQPVPAVWYSYSGGVRGRPYNVSWIRQNAASASARAHSKSSDRRARVSIIGPSGPRATPPPAPPCRAAG